MGEYNIPLFSLNYGQEEMDAVLEPIKNNWISMGPKCMELERLFCDMLHVSYACAVTNCTAALHLACYALGISSGDEVICPSLTFSATANCIRYVGATPVFCDVSSENDFGLDANMLERLVTERTKAVIPMHFAGFPCDMDAIMDIARKHHLFVIEDACHGPLSEYHGKKLGTIGDVGCFSFFSNKNISTGEGGMLVTNNKKIYEKVKLARSHGMSTMSYERASGHATSYEIKTLGFNYRLDDVRASLGCAQMKKLPADIEQRAVLRKWYEDRLGQIKGIVVPYNGLNGMYSNYILPVVLKHSNAQKRDNVRERLKRYGIQTSVHYPAVHRFELYKGFRADVPKTEYITDNEITLPMYGKLKREEVEYVCDSLEKAVEQAR